MKKILIAVILLFLLSLAANVYITIRCISLNAELKQEKQLLKAQETNGKVVYFMKLFTDKVLSQSGTVGFEDRLKLENAVRDINDAQIFNSWQEFVNSESDEDAQKSVGMLFDLLIGKINK